MRQRGSLVYLNSLAWLHRVPRRDSSMKLIQVAATVLAMTAASGTLVAQPMEGCPSSKEIGVRFEEFTQFHLSCN